MSRVGDKGGRYHHGDLRRALVSAAVELVQESGPEGITLREAARRAGVTHAAPYRHFADKEALLAAVAEQGFAQLGSALRSALAGAEAPSGGAGSPRALPGKIEALGVAYVRFARENPSQFRVMFGSLIADKARFRSLLDAYQSVFELLRGAIADAQEQGSLPQADTVRMGMVAWSMLHGVAALAVDGQLARAAVRDIDEFAGNVARTALRGLAQWSESP
jgi:AcrR family transcriptional regulator